MRWKSIAPISATTVLHSLEGRSRLERQSTWTWHKLRVLVPILLSAVLVVAAWVFLWNHARLVAALAWAALVLATWPLRAGLWRYGRGPRDGRMHR